MNTLRKYVKNEVKIGNASFIDDVMIRLAYECGITKAAIKNTVYGYKQTLAENVLKIEKATNGKVSRTDLRPDIYPKNFKNPTTSTLTLSEYIINQIDYGNFARKIDVYKHLATLVSVEISTIETWANKPTAKPSGVYILALARATDWTVTAHTLRPDLYPENLEDITYDDKTVLVSKKARVLSPHERMQRVEEFIELYGAREQEDLAEEILRLPEGLTLNTESLVSKLNKKWS